MTPVIIITEHQKHLELAQDGGGDWADLGMPVPISRGRYLQLSIPSLFEIIEKHICLIREVRAVVIFGSSVKLRKVKKFFGLVTKYQWDRFANDIDIFVLVDDGIICEEYQNVKASAISAKRKRDYCGGYFVKEGTREKGLDIFAMDKKGLENKIDLGDSVSQSIINGGVLFLGEFPFELKSNIKLDWPFHGRARFFIPNGEQT